MWYNEQKFVIEFWFEMLLNIFHIDAIMHTDYTHSRLNITNMWAIEM